MSKSTLLILMVSLAQSTACQPHRSPTDPARAQGSRVAPLDAKEARTLAKRYTHRAERCFAQIFAASQGRKLIPTERQDAARRGRALVRLDTELRSCLTGSGYRGEAMVSGAVVKRWLAAPDCAGFARAAFTSRACFALSGVLDQVGYKTARPRPRLGSPGGPGGAAPPACATPEPPTGQGYYAASHILFFYRGAKRAPARVTRTKAAARQLARRIAALTWAPGADFAKLAMRWSEGPSAPRGGRLGRFKASQMVPPFSKAVARLCIGHISGPVETVFGFHVILRNTP